MGQLTARALPAGARPVLAGRDAERLVTLAKQLGCLDTAVAGAGLLLRPAGGRERKSATAQNRRVSMWSPPRAMTPW